MRTKTIGKFSRITVLGAVALLCGCSSMSKILNPFYEDPDPTALLGERNDHAISGSREKTQNARQALETMASYQRAHLPQPVHPVVQPSVVRLMWVPDHLNKSGDMVPAHFYYLKVLKDRWAVSDVFELEQQLHTGGPGSASNIPFVHQNDVAN